MALTNLATEGSNQVHIARQNALPSLIALAAAQDTEASRYAGEFIFISLYLYIFTCLVGLCVFVYFVPVCTYDHTHSFISIYSCPCDPHAYNTLQYAHPHTLTHTLTNTHTYLTNHTSPSRPTHPYQHTPYQHTRIPTHTYHITTYQHTHPYHPISTPPGMCIANLAANRQNRGPIVSLGGLRPLVLMAFAKSLETQRSAALSLYNLSCAAINHVPMIKADIITAVSNLGNVQDLECKRFAIMTLANLAANAETRAAATRTGGLQTAVTLGRDEDLECRRYACIAMCNLANSPVTQEQLVVHGALPMLLAMASVGGSGGDVESQRQALLALGNLCACEVNHSTMMHKVCKGGGVWAGV